MTILELLVATSLGMVLMGMTVSATLSNREAFSYDIARTRLNQSLRGAFDLLASEMRQAGERLPPGFPAVEIVNGTSGESDELILRRNLRDEVLTLCQAITTTSGSDVLLSTTAGGAPPACTYGSQRVNYDAWRAYRESQPGDKTVAYIYNFTTRLGEFFDYTEEFDSGSALGIRRSSGNFSQPYAMSTTAVYLIREWRFKLSTTAGQTDLLQIVQDGDTDNPFKVAFGINAFNVTARMQDGTTLTTFTNANAWTLLSAVEVSLTGNATYRGRPIATTLTTRLFPRNILSN